MAEEIAIRKGKHITVCIDEFQQAGEWTDSRSIQARMRAAWQHHQHANYCLFGSKQHMMSAVQHLASIIYNMTAEGDTVTEGMIDPAISQLISTNEMLYMQQVEPLSAYQMNLLRAIVSGIHTGFNEKQVRKSFDLGSPSNFVRLRDALIHADLIYSEMKELYITDPVFSLWFRRRFS